jgi:hypothetical protein
MSNDVEHFFIYFLTIWTSTFEKALFHLSAHFFIVSLILWNFSFLSFLCILLESLIRCIAEKDVLPFCGLPLQSDDHFFFCAAAFKIPCSLICQSFLWVNWVLLRKSLSMPVLVCSLLLSALVSKFQELY